MSTHTRPGKKAQARRRQGALARLEAVLPGYRAAVQDNPKCLHFQKQRDRIKDEIKTLEDRLSGKETTH